MSNLVLEKSLQQIKAALLASGRTEITGALLGELIRSSAKELNVREVVNIPTGPGAVTKFAEAYLQDVLVKKGSQGSDRTYEIKVADELRESGTADPGLWLAFVRPRSSSKILLDKSSMKLELMILASQPNVDGKLVVESATTKELDGIRVSFTEGLAEKNPDLAIQLDATKPYAEWSNALKKISRDKTREWAEFRINKIIELFGSRLSTLGVNDDTVRSLSQELRRSQNVGHAGTLAQRLLPPTELSREMVPTDTASALKNPINFREAMIQVISNMSDDELRELRVPPGAMYDTLTGKNKK